MGYLSFRLRLAVFGANLDIRSFKRCIIIFLLSLFSDRRRLYKRLAFRHFPLSLLDLRNGSEHELLLFHLHRLRLFFQPVSPWFKLEFVDKSVIHHGILHRKIYGIRHIFLIGEADFRLCGVDIDIHCRRRKFYHKDAGREFACHYHVGIGVFQRR